VKRRPFAGPFKKEFVSLMALMQSLRDKTHVVMIVLVVAFIGLIGLEWGADITGRGAGAGDTVGSVNGVKVSYQEIRAEYDQLRQLESERRGGSLDEMRERQLLDEIWNRRVEFLLIKEQIEKRGIKVTDGELIEAIRMTPPEFLKTQEIFQTEGRFDQAKYLQVLNNPNVQGLEVIEEQYRTLLPSQKVVDRLNGIVRVTEQEVRRAFLDQNENVSVKYLFFDPNGFSGDPVAVSEQEIRAYYDKNKTEFEQDKRIRLEYAMLAKRPSAADSLRVQRQVEDLHQLLIGGADFEKLARSFSEDPSNASRGGDLGFFKRGDMVAPFEAAAFGTEPGQVAAPVQTQFGWHIVKVEEKKTENDEEQVRARHILLKTAIGQETLSGLRKKAQSLLDKARDTGFQEAAKSVPEASIENTGYFAERTDGFMPRLGYVMGAGSFAASAAPGDYSEVFENDNAFYVLRLVDRKEKGVQELAEVKTVIESQLTREKRMEKARMEGERVKTLMGSGSLDNLPVSEAAKVVTLEPFARQGFIPGVGQDVVFASAALKLSSGQVSGLVKGERGYYLIQAIDRIPADEAAYAAQKTSIRDNLMLQKQNQLYTDWVAELREKAVIENNMGKFFVY